MRKNRLAAVLCVLSMGAGWVSAMDYMGPPTSGLDFGKWGAGVTYFYSEEDLDFDDTTLEDFETNRYYGWVGYGLSDWWELYTRLGVIEVETDDLGFEDSANFAGSLGTKVTFSRGERVDWGFLIQGTWSQADDDYTVDLSEFGLGTERFDIDIDYMEFQAAVGPVIKFEGWKLYGGPFYYCLDGETEIGFNGSETDFDLEEDENIGGYAGVIIDLGPSAALNVEGMFTGGGWGAGASVGWEF